MNQLKVKDIDDDKRNDLNNRLRDTINDFYIRRTKDEKMPPDFPKKIVVYERINPSKIQSNCSGIKKIEDNF